MNPRSSFSYNQYHSLVLLCIGVLLMFVYHLLIYTWTPFFFFYIPRSNVTTYVNDRLRTYTMPYTIVYMSNTLRIRPYFSVLHVPALRPYVSVIVYGEIRKNTEIVYGVFTTVNDRNLSVYGRKPSYFD